MSVWQTIDFSTDYVLTSLEGEDRCRLLVVQEHYFCHRSVVIWHFDEEIRRSLSLDSLKQDCFVVSLRSMNWHDASTRCVQNDHRYSKFARCSYVHLQSGSKLRWMRTVRIDHHWSWIRHCSITAVHTVALNELVGMRIRPKVIGGLHSSEFQCTWPNWWEQELKWRWRTELTFEFT